MADDFWNCPYTGGEKPCNPSCVNFVRNHSTLQGVRKEDYCRQFGCVGKGHTLIRLKQEEGDIEHGL